MAVNKAEIRRTIKSIKDNPEHFEFRRIFTVKYCPRERNPSNLIYVVDVTHSMFEDEGLPTKDFLSLGGAMRANACGTAACIAGFVVVNNGDEFDREHRKSEGTLSWQDFAQQKLGLSYDDATDLFCEECSVATAEDAIKRLEWLERYGTLKEYPWVDESYYGPEYYEADPE